LREICDYCFRMFLPEYTITSKIIRNISDAEYARAVIENTPILPSWEKQLKKETRIRTVSALLKLSGITFDASEVKKYVDGLLSNVSPEMSNVSEALDELAKSSRANTLDEDRLKHLYETVSGTKRSAYRGKRIEGKVSPEEILAKLVQFFDWLATRNAMESHPLIIAAIVKACLEIVQPFENYNQIASSLMAEIYLKTSGYHFGGYVSIIDYYQKSGGEYEQLINSLGLRGIDFTEWVEYFTEGFAIESMNAKEKVKLLSRDTKVAKATGRAKLSDRQERIVEYLQDYSILQNKDFGRVFPDVSEDTVLRQLKVLMDRGIVVKRGSTKSSRYELK